MVLEIRSTITLQKHSPIIIIRSVMPRRYLLWNVAVTVAALLAVSCGLCGAAEQVVRGALRLVRVPASVNLQPATPTRQGSLTFIFDPEKEPNSSHAFHRMRNEKLKRMDPSVECSDNKMTLKVKRISAIHFLLDTGDKPLTPLSHVPSKCGFTVKRSRRDVKFAAPYRGCYVTQQGDEYTLPLRLWGKPLAMSCPATLSSPSVFCFPSGMVVKLDDVLASDLTVKVSSMWKSISSASESCGLIVEVIPGGLTLTAPYNKGLCTVKKGEEYLLTLLWADVELLVTCPSVPNIKPTLATTPLSDSRPTVQHSLYPKVSNTPPKPVTFSTPTQTTTFASVPSLRPFSVATVDKDVNQDVPSVEDLAATVEPQYLRLPKPVLPMQLPATKTTAAPLDPSSQLLLSQQYLLSILPKYHILAGNVYPTIMSTPFATSTKAVTTSPKPSTAHSTKPEVSQHDQGNNPFLSFLKHQPSPINHPQAAEVHKPVNQQPQGPEDVYTQTYHVPVLYPPKKYLSEQQNTAAAPTTTSTTSAIITQTPSTPKLFYHPHPYMEVYYVPQHAALLVLPDLPTTPSTHKTQPDIYQTITRAVPPLQHAFSHHQPKPGERVW